MSNEVDGLREAIERRRSAAAEAAKAQLKAMWESAKPLIALAEERIRTLKAVSEEYLPFLDRINDIDVSEMLSSGSIQWSGSFNSARNQLRTLLDPKRITEVQKALAELRSLDPSALDFPSRFVTIERYITVETSGVAEACAAARNQVEHSLKQYGSFTAGSSDRVVGYVSPDPVQTVQRNVKPHINVKR